MVCATRSAPPGARRGWRWRPTAKPVAWIRTSFLRARGIPSFLRRKTALDTQDGQVDPISVIDDGTEDLSLGARAIWSDKRGRLVQVKLIGSDDSVISYKPI
jgi:hypothetical protein